MSSQCATVRRSVIRLSSSLGSNVGISIEGRPGVSEDCAASMDSAPASGAAAVLPHRRVIHCSDSFILLARDSASGIPAKGFGSAIANAPGCPESEGDACMCRYLIPLARSASTTLAALYGCRLDAAAPLICDRTERTT